MSKFAQLKEKFAREGKTNPGGLAYSIGVKKYGKKGMARKAAAGRHHGTSHYGMNARFM